MKTQSQCKCLGRNNERDMLFNPTTNHAQKPNTHVQNVICTFIRLIFCLGCAVTPHAPGYNVEGDHGQDNFLDPGNQLTGSPNIV